MTMENKMNISSPTELAQVEEKISKLKALQLFEQGKLGDFEVGSFKGLAAIHRYLFENLYQFAGELRTVNIAKGRFRFAPVLYLKEAIANIDTMPQSNFHNIIEKYIEMNVAHPFRDGNGRSMRIWLDAILSQEIGKVIDWSKIDKDDYLFAMERSTIKDTEIKLLLGGALTDRINDREVYTNSIDASYHYEGYSAYKAANLAGNK